MKRSEKIEIRVSLSEKDRLAELAKQEGESVSGLIRGLVEKYVALNSPSATRKLPKWQMAGLLVIAALIGHGLTWIPIHLHDREHAQSAQVPVYYVHGAIDDSAFGVSFQPDAPPKEFQIKGQDNKYITIRLAFLASEDQTGQLQVNVCEGEFTENCAPIFDDVIGVERIAPSVLGGETKTGKPVHIFVQEMA